MKDHTLYYDLDNINSIVERLGALIIVPTYTEIPLTATLLCDDRKYAIKQHTTQYDKQTGKYLNVYIAEDIYG